MNAERLHAIAVALYKEMTDNNTVEKLQNLVESLQNVVNNPHPSHQQNLANSLKVMYATVTDTPSDKFSPTWRQILTDIDGEDLFGQTLKTSIESIFARNQITLAVAMEELQQLHNRLKIFKIALNGCISAFQEFNIGDEKLTSGECEVGILIPRQAVDNHLLNFADELKDLSFIFNTFSEVATGKIDGLSIKTISSSDLLVYLSAAAPYAACLAVAIERTVSLYKQLLEIRKLHQELRVQGVPDNQTSGIENYANQLIEKGIETVSKEIVEQFYKENDKGRKNELTTAVRVSLNMLANRIDKGFNLEVRVEPMAKEETEDADKADTQQFINLIQAATKNMRFLKLDGNPILKLPEGKKK
jgi:hypothetical protein